MDEGADTDLMFQFCLPNGHKNAKHLARSCPLFMYGEMITGIQKALESVSKLPVVIR